MSHSPYLSKIMIYLFISFRGSWRPDILYPQNDLDRFQICEINARFPFNAFYVSHEKNNILGRLSYLKGMFYACIQGHCT